MEWLEAWSVCTGGQKFSINYRALFWFFCRNDGPVYSLLERKKKRERKRALCPLQIYRKKKGAKKFNICPYQYSRGVIPESKSPQVDPVSPTRLRYTPEKGLFYTFFVTLWVPNTELGTLKTFCKFTDFLTDLGSLKLPNLELFVQITALKRSEPRFQN